MEGWGRAAWAACSGLALAAVGGVLMVVPEVAARGEGRRQNEEGRSRILDSTAKRTNGTGLGRCRILDAGAVSPEVVTGGEGRMRR